MDTQERLHLDAEEISAFCNAIGLAPRQLREARDAVTARYNLGPRGAWIIGLIERGITSPSALTDVLCIGRSLATAEIARMTEAGLVSASQSAVDGRRVDLALTQEGCRVADELRDAIGEFVTRRLAGHSRAEVLAAIRLLRDFSGADRFGDAGE